MNVRRLQYVFVIAAVGAVGLMMSATACSNPHAECLDLCARENKCAGATMQNCDTQCANEESLASKWGCTGQFDDELSCADGLSDVCNAQNLLTECPSQAVNVLSCETTYCKAHASDPSCAGLGG